MKTQKAPKGQTAKAKKVSAKVLSERAHKAWATRRKGKNGKTAGRRAAMKAWATRRAAVKVRGRAK